MKKKKPLKPTRRKFIAIDTEFTTERLPYYVSTCDENGRINSWEFDVSPRRKVTVPKSFSKEFSRVTSGKQAVFHNAKADVPVLRKIGFDFCPNVIDPPLGPHGFCNPVSTPLGVDPAFPPENLPRAVSELPYHDTMIASHLWRSDKSHKLKDLAWELLEYGIADEKHLIDVIKQARDVVQRYPEVFKYGIFKPEHAATSGDGQSWLKWDSWLPSNLVRLDVNLLYRHGVPQSRIAEWQVALSSYGNADAERTMGLWLFFQKWFDEHEVPGVNYWERYWEAMQILPCVMDMEARGVTLHLENLESERDKYQTIRTEALIQVKSVIREVAPPNKFGKGEFNVNSDIQVAKLLHDEWKFPVITRTDGGKPSVTDKVLKKHLAWLETNAPKTPKVEDAIVPKRLEKMAFVEGMIRLNTCETALRYLNSYLDVSRPSWLPSDDSVLTVYPSYNPIGTKTTRFSSSEPNITNVGKGREQKDEDPEYDEDGNEIKRKEFQLRKCFGPAPDRIWFAIDYKQLQLVIFAHMTQDPLLLSIFRQGKDIHDEVAREMFDTKEPTELERRAAKAVNFGIIFGSGDKKTDLSSGLPGTSAKFREKLPGAGRYMSDLIAKVRRTGLVTTMGGYPLLVERQKAYTGVCYIDQGTEGQLVKRAMVNCRSYLLDTDDYLRFMVHDELVFDFAVRPTTRKQDRLIAEMESAGAEDASIVYSQYKGPVTRLKEIMQEAARSVGVDADCSVSVIPDNWADAYELPW